MKTAEKAKRSIQSHTKAIAKIRKGLQEAILACPGPSKAAGIKTLGPRCATISSSKLLMGSWSADTYIFSVQYEALAELVNKGDPATIIDRLSEALDKGKVRRDFNPGNSLVLHPEVIANVRKMMEAV